MVMEVAAMVLITVAKQHSSLISPRPRNAVDRDLFPWRGAHWGPGVLPHNSTCDHPAHEDGPHGANDCWGCTCVNGTEPCDVAQTCVWFSQGCSIGCQRCDGQESNPNTRDRCGSGKVATNNDPYYRTYNRGVKALSPEDIYKYNPWRSPGNAPVYDACGMAGGSPTWVNTQLSFVNTSHAVQGDLGSKILPKSPTGVKWKAGTTVEAKWSLRANHGGGYIYRLCPLSEALSEACFQKYPLDFARETYLEWSNGTRLAIEGRFLTSSENVPPNSTWAMNMLPFSDKHRAPEFDPPCKESVDRTKNDTGKCSGRFPWDVAIVDILKIPHHLSPGEYVLGFRYDCEATAQVWSSCADIEIT